MADSGPLKIKRLPPLKHTPYPPPPIESDIKSPDAKIFLIISAPINRLLLNCSLIVFQPVSKLTNRQPTTFSTQDFHQCIIDLNVSPNGCNMLMQNRPTLLNPTQVALVWPPCYTMKHDVG